MTSVKGPLERHLRAPLNEEQLQGVAMRLKAQRHARSFNPRWVWAAATAVAMALVLFVFQNSWRPSTPAPLTQANGSALPLLLSAGTVTLSDGSSISMEENIQAQVITNQPSQLTLLMRSGKASFSVKPGGPRKWLVEAGVATVEVVGTLFTVNRTERGVEVSVDRGTVVVRAASLPDGLVRLDAGMKTFVAAVEKSRAEATTNSGGSSAVHTTPSPAIDAQRVATKESKGAVSIRSAAPSQTAQTTERPAVGARPSDIEALWKNADDARAKNDHVSAAQWLEKLVEQFPSDSSTPSAAFSLARIELEQLKKASTAAKHFELAAGAPALRADARVRQIQAHLAAGELPQALDVARAELKDNPDSTHARRLRNFLDDPEHRPQWLY